MKSLLHRGNASDAVLPAAIAACLLQPANAQQLEEIIVTAERREATELTSALSLEVFSAEDLAQDRLETVMDLQRAMPNLTIAHTGGGTQSVNIRGVGNNVVNPNIQPGVAIFQDGMIMAETIVIQSAFLDVATIEVLRGPQGTFVGQSSTGGAVRINSARPNLDGISGHFEGILGAYSSQKISGAVNVPLSDTLSTRFAFSQETRDSYYTNLGDQGAGPGTGRGLVEIGAREDRTFRASILWQPSDSFSVLGRIELNETDRRGSAPYQPNPRTFANPLDLITGIGESDYAEAARQDGTLDDPFTLAWDRNDSFATAVANRYSLEVSKTFDNGVEFRSLTGFQYNDYRYIEDFDATTANGNWALVDIGPDNNHNGQEFNLISPDDGPVTWILGASWFHRETPVNLNFRNNNCGYNAIGGGQIPCPPAGAVPSIFFLEATTVQRHAGLFGQLTWDISDALELEFGARNSWDNNTDVTGATLGLEGAVDVPFPCSASIRPGLPTTGAYGCLPLGPPVFSKHKDSTPTYKVGLNWTPTDDQFVYVFYARGYKSGGVNNGLAFQEELVDDIEIGWKGTVLDGRMQVQLGAFFMDYSQMQQSTFRVSTVPGTLSNAGSILNIGDSTIQGVEVSIDAAFGGLGVNFSAGYTDSDLGGIDVIDARFLDPSLNTGGNNYIRGCAPGEAAVPGPGGCHDYSAEFISLASAQNIFSPELSYNLSLDYAFELQNGATLRPRISLSHLDEQYTSLFQGGDYFRLDEHDLTHVSVTYERDAWMVQAYCNNCGEEVYVASQGGGGNTVVYGDPRTAGVRFNVRF
jgi:iron complex outermembrane receptor protein